MQVKVIVGKDTIFTTYHKSICFEQKFFGLDSMDKVLSRAKIAAFNYAIGSFGKTHLALKVDENILNCQDVFAYLDKVIK